ncbi:hypothetical protein Plhal304r1_c086g0169571 [Plasmopara halstedii]
MREGDDVVQSIINFWLEKDIFDMHKGQMEGASFEYGLLSLHNQGRA